MRWEHAQWRKLYVREEGSFAMLPLYARALAGELLKFCDDEGRIFIGKRDPADAVARITRAETGERRLLRQHIPALIDDGYLIVDGEYLRIRNLERAQEKKRGNAASGDEARPETSATEADLARTSNERVRNELGTTSARTANDSGTNRERDPNELETKIDSSARNHSGEPLTCTRARSVLNREEKSSTEEISASSASAGTRDGRTSAPEPVASKPQESAAEASGAPSHVPAPESPALPPSRPSNGQSDAGSSPAVAAPQEPDLLTMAHELAVAGNAYGRKMVDHAALGRSFSPAQKETIRKVYAEHAEGLANAVRAAAIRSDQAPPTPRSGHAAHFRATSPPMTYEAQEAQRRRMGIREPPPPPRPRVAGAPASQPGGSRG